MKLIEVVLTREIYFPLEDKLHVFVSLCNILYIFLESSLTTIHFYQSACGSVAIAVVNFPAVSLFPSQLLLFSKTLETYLRGSGTVDHSSMFVFCFPAVSYKAHSMVTL